jgi:hypothetical protein
VCVCCLVICRAKCKFLSLYEILKLFFSLEFYFLFLSLCVCCVFSSSLFRNNNGREGLIISSWFEEKKMKRKKRERKGMCYVNLTTKDFVFKKYASLSRCRVSLFYFFLVYENACVCVCVCYSVLFAHYTRGCLLGEFLFGFYCSNKISNTHTHTHTKQEFQIVHLFEKILLSLSLSNKINNNNVKKREK